MFTGKVKDADADPGPGTRVALRRAVLEFDIAGAIPPGATIDSVQLTLYCDKVGQNTSFNVSLHRALSEWGEGTSNTGNSQQGRGEPATTNDATWRHTFYSTQFWTLQGGDYALTASATVAVGGSGTSYTWGSTSGMVADVQAWLDERRRMNHGWVIVGTETQIQTAKRFATRENATVNNRPRLVVNYTPQTVQGACCNGSTCALTAPGACVPPAVYKGDGTTCSPNPCRRAGRRVLRQQRHLHAGDAVSVRGRRRRLPWRQHDLRRGRMPDRPRRRSSTHFRSRPTRRRSVAPRAVPRPTTCRSRSRRSCCTASCRTDDGLGLRRRHARVPGSSARSSRPARTSR